MRIQIIPGPRNEEKIETVNQIYALNNLEEWEAFVNDCAEDEEWLDALCHAAGTFGKQALEEQAKYLHERLLDDERYYFAARLGGIDTDF